MNPQQQPPQGQQGQGGQQNAMPGATGQGGQQHAMPEATGQGGQQHSIPTATGQGGGWRLQDVESPEQREAVHAIARAIQVCEWCADQCIQEADPNMVECIRLCEDVSELGESALTLVPRQSRFAGQQLDAFLQAAQACAAECGRHSHGHCQECAQVLQGTTQSVGSYLSILHGQGDQGGPQGQPTGQ